MTGPTEILQDAAQARASLLRYFVFEALAPVEGDSTAARLYLTNNDDTGACYHFKRAVEHLKAAASTFRELENLKEDGR